MNLSIFALITLLILIKYQVSCANPIAILCQGILSDCFPSTASYWTPSAGLSNGTLNTYTNLNRLEKVRLMKASLIDGIQFTFVDGQSTGYYGGIGGDQVEWYVSRPGQCDCVSKVITYSDMHINGIQFVTKKGRQSQLFGSSTGTFKQFVFPDGYSIHGIQIQSNTFVNYLSFYVSPNYR